MPGSEPRVRENEIGRSWYAFVAAAVCVLLGPAGLFAAPSADPGAVAPAGNSTGTPDVEEIMRRNFLVGKVVDSRGDVAMTLTNARGFRRERATVTITKLLPNGIDQKRLIRFRAPPEVRGTATLLIEHADGDDNIWIYLPALRKVRRLVANNKKDSFVGTDFSYGDIIGHRVEDWTYDLLGTEIVDGAETYVVEALPRSDTVREHAGYSKRKLWVRRDNYVAIRGLYWDTGGALLKQLTASEVREIDPANGKWQALYLRMANQQTGHATVFRVSDLKVGIGLDDTLFSERHLERSLDEER